MFEVGWSEYLVIFGLALVVLGPEKLPKLAASIGRWVGRARVMARQFRDQLESETQTIRSSVHDVQKDFESASSDLHSSVADTPHDTAAEVQGPPSPQPAAQSAQESPTPDASSVNPQNPLDTSHAAAPRSEERDERRI